MEIVNQTPFKFASIVGRIGFPNYSLSLIIKGTFNLTNGDMSVYSEEQLCPTGDELYEDDDEGQGSCRYESDFAYFKPRADLLLAGKCYVPNEKPTKVCRVTFQVGNKSKSLAVIGTRYWNDSFKSITDPEPFTEMELRYENSYGGEGYKKNPVGKGFKKEQNGNEAKLWPLPNIENIQQRNNSPDDHSDLAGFGPLGKMWHERFSKMGTYKRTWLKERWPWFPKDFDWSHFNAAPPDMQVEGFLKGDEAFFFENLHPTHSQYRSQLPCVRIRLFVNTCHKGSLNDPQFKEVSVNLDTLWVDMEAEKLVLVWRGLTAVQSEDYEEIQHIFIISEKLEAPKQSIDYYHDLLLKKLAEEDADESYDVKPLEVEDAEDTKEVDAEIAKAEAHMRASLLEAGIDPDNLPEPTAEQKAEEARILKEMGIEDEPKEDLITREIFLERVKKGEAFIGEDLRELELSGLELEGINLQSAILSGVCFNKTNLSGATLTKTNLAGADLSGADLKGANLKEADLTGANLQGADLTGAFLDDAIFEKARLARATLDEVTAIDTIFSETNLAGARLINSNLKGADFSKSNIEKTNFQGANLCEASVEGAMGKQVNMTEADLTELRASGGCDFSHGFFRKAKGQESNWEGAKLAGADFTFTQMEGADFTSADLESANLSAANMKYTRFTKANLKEAKLVQINLFKGSLEKADLTRADFRGSNLYGVEFLDSIVDETVFEFSNLKMTKLSQG
ncbi:MAG: DUF2169 domain-containing protein [Desulfobacterales bacterium]|nr:DUF2169 domain-containing protein [Desulfobacterales bacterium]